MLFRSTNDSLGETFDLTNHLRKNHLLAHELEELLTIYPLLKREVGEIPADWLNNVKDKKQATKEIYKAFQNFQNSKNTSAFSINLTKILSKKTTVEYLSKGAYGTTYKIEIDGAKTTCAKLFHTNFNTYNDLVNGGHYEVQAALFLNAHSSDFVKMHFGKVAGKENKDGFLVTQFLSDSITPIEEKTIPNNFNIKYLDNKPQNIINGKIVDFGGVYIENN